MSQQIKHALSLTPTTQEERKKIANMPPEDFSTFIDALIPVPIIPRELCTAEAVGQHHNFHQYMALS